MTSGEDDAVVDPPDVAKASPGVVPDAVIAEIARLTTLVPPDEAAVILAADLATRMAERVPTPHGSRDATPGAPTTMSIVVYRHDPAKLASALATLLGVS